MKENINTLIGKIIVAIVVFWFFVPIIYGFLNVEVKSLYNIGEKNGKLAYELQQLYLINNAQLDEFQVLNLYYINKNKLHCKVSKIKSSYNLYNALLNNGWTFNGTYYVKDNLVAVVNEQGDNVNLDLYYK